MRHLILSLLLSASAIISMQARSLVVALTDGREIFYLLGNEPPTIVRFTASGMIVNDDTYDPSEVATFYISATDAPDGINALNPQPSPLNPQPRKFLYGGRVLILDADGRMWDMSGRPSSLTPHPSSLTPHSSSLTPQPLRSPLGGSGASRSPLGGSGASPVTLWGTVTSNGFLTSKIQLQLAADETLRFDAMRFYVVHADESEERYLFTKADHFFLSEPAAGVHRPNYLRNNDFNSENSRYCFARSRQSDHFIVFWEPNFGLDPTQADVAYAFDPDEFLQRAERVYSVYTNQLGFPKPGSSWTQDTYKIIMFVHYQTEWRATGSGVDFKCGTLDVCPDAVKADIASAHEIGHTFQYIVACDFSDPRNHGWQWGFEESTTGLCGWWESCAQWQAFKVYPEQQFTSTWANNIYGVSHLNLLHEEMRYDNFYVQDYWCQLHGQDFIGRLWMESVRPEDPVETYRRLTNTSHEDFCRDMYDYACRAITWDIDALRDNGRRRIDGFTTKLKDAGQGWWQVDSVNCPQNYGFNVIRLRVPEAGRTVKADFRGIAGAKGYRAYNIDKAGWRYGFVALTASGERVYGPMSAAPEGTATFTVPEGTTNLWFVVCGAPTEHWHHPWDMVTDANGNDVHTPASLANDEQWPYQVFFTGTNLPGEYYYPADYERHDIDIPIEVPIDKTKATTTNIQVKLELPMVELYEALGMSSADVKALRAGNEPPNLRLRALNADGSESDSHLITNMYYWGFDADANVITGNIASTDYVLTVAYSAGSLNVTGVRARLNIGTTYHAAVAFICTVGDKEYKGIIRLQIPVS